MLKNKKIISIILSLSLTLGLFFYTPSFADSVKTITIIHTNDVRGRAEGDDKEIIGYAKLKTFYDEQKLKNPNTLLLDAGNTFHGTTFANISEGKNMLKLMNEIGYSIGVPGNHDFNYGYEQLLSLIKEAKFDYLCANIVKKEDGNSDFKANIIKEVDGVKIGFFGIVTPETLYKSSPKNTKDVKFLDYIEESKKQVEDLKKQGASIIIAITHLGIDESSDERSDILAKEVKGIDIIIDGHSQTMLEEGKKEGDTLIAQAGEYLKNIGVVELKVKNGKLESSKAHLVSFDEAKEIKADEKILNLIKKADESNKPTLDKMVGYTNTELIGVRERVRTGETNLGDLVTDSMRNSISADVAITNGGSIRASIKSGDIKMGDILTSFPFTNFVVGLEVKGDVIKSAVEHGVDKAPEPAGKFPHVSGMTFTYDLSRSSGERVIDININGMPLDNEKTYKLATNDFLSIGGDGYKMLIGQKSVAENALLSDVLIEYIKSKNGKVDYKDQAQRIKVISDAKSKNVSEKSSNLEIVPTEHKLVIAGKSYTVKGYSIKGDKYFQLRDLAIVFNNSATSFDVKYDKKTNSVILKRNAKYTSSNMKLSSSIAKSPKIMPTVQKILIDAKEDTTINAYVINGANYVNLTQFSTLMNLDLR